MCTSAVPPGTGLRNTDLGNPTTSRRMFFCTEQVNIFQAAV